MKKILIFGVVVLIAVVALGAASFSYARAQLLPQAIPSGMVQMMNSGGMLQGGRGGHGPGMMGGAGAYGPMHTYMISGFADAFNLTVDELETRLNDGETMWDIAQEQGLSEEQFSELMIEVRTEAMAQAVADGVITQEQADFMLERMSQMWENGYGPGSCHGAGGAGMGNGGGRRGGRWNSQP